MASTNDLDELKTLLSQLDLQSPHVKKSKELNIALKIIMVSRRLNSLTEKEKTEFIEMLNGLKGFQCLNVGKIIGTLIERS